MNSSKSQSERPTGKRSIYLIALLMTGFAALFGGLMGWFFFSQFLEQMGKAFGFDFLENNSRWIGAVLFGYLSGASTFRTFSKSAMAKERRQAAKKLGFREPDSLENELLEDLERILGNRGTVDIHNAVLRESDLGRIVIADLDFSEHQQHPTGRTIDQTVISIDAVGLSLPTFSMTPEGKLTNLLSSFAGNFDIDFEDHPDFSRQYLLFGADPDRVKTFFNRELLQYFSEHAGWQIMALKNQMVIYRPGEIYDGVAMETMISDATAIFVLLRNRATQLSQSANCNEIRPPNAKQLAAEIPGIAGTVVRASLVAHSDIQRIISQPPPRYNLPKPLVSIGCGFKFVLLFALSLGFVGSIFLLSAFYFLDNSKNSPALFMLLSISMITASILLITFVFLMRHRRRWLLIHGKLAVGQLRNVRSTRFYVDNKRRYLTKIEYAINGMVHKKEFPTYGISVDHAREAKKYNREVHILCHPRDPTRAVWLEGLITAPPDFH